MKKIFIPLLSAGLAIGLTACNEAQTKPTPAVKTGEPATHLDVTEVVGVPETGINLGWGWDSFESKSVPTICVEFDEAYDSAQTVTSSFHEVSDSYEAMRRLGVSAEATVKSIGYEASGKAKFAKELKIDNFSSTFILEAAVDNGVRYAAPVAVAAIVEPRSGSHPVDSSQRHNALRLTDEAFSLARKNIAQFKHQCGNSFVSAIYSGARLSAFVSVKTSSQKEKESLEASLSGKGFGAQVDAAFSESSASSKQKSEKDVKFFQVGGNKEGVPTGKAEIIERVKNLAVAADEAPKNFYMAVTPYETLSNWPGSEITGEEQEFEQIASLWGGYRTIYNEIEAILKEPQKFSIAIADKTGEVAFSQNGLSPVDISAMEDLQDEIMGQLEALRIAARTCTTAEEACEFDEASFRDPYAYRVQLPLPVGFTQTADNLVDLYVREPAKSRCRIGLETPGCLSNRGVREWAGRVGMTSVKLENWTAFEAVKTTFNANKFTFDVEGTELPIVWFPAAEWATASRLMSEAGKSAEPMTVSSLEKKE